MDESPGGQLQLPLPMPPLEDMPLIPVRMVNEHVYCPRLAYLEWVQREWADSTDTVEGRHAHRRVDRSSGDLPDADQAEDEQRIHARSVSLSSAALGIVARLDLVEGRGREVTPVDYKRGRRPHIPKGAYDPERVQLCAQGLLLEEAGYTCSDGILYYVASKERVRVPFDDELRALTHSAIIGLRLTAAGGRMPPPLEDSPKCGRCSLVSICLPDEVNFLRASVANVRPLAVERPRALPAYVQAHGARIAKDGDRLEITAPDRDPTHVRIGELSQLVLMGNVAITTPTLHELMRREIPVSWLSYGGWFLGHTAGTGHGNVEVRTAQYRASFDEQVCLAIARGLVRAKVQNARTLMRRNWRSSADPEPVLRDLGRFAEQARRVRDQQTLLGVEGAAAAVYFSHLPDILRQADAQSFAFDFNGRNRRPPLDPVNALLSFAYSLLTRTFSTTLSAVGFDVFRGFYHQPRYGRPALALDIMEPFRPLLADSVVITAINNEEVRPTDFLRVAGAVNLTDDGRKRFIGVYAETPLDPA